jgi:peroxiredoxin Q/BCP
MFGRRYFGNERTTFVIDRKGRIAKIFRAVKSEGHAEQVARAVEDMGA